MAKKKVKCPKCLAGVEHLIRSFGSDGIATLECLKCGYKVSGKLTTKPKIRR